MRAGQVSYIAAYSNMTARGHDILVHKRIRRGEFFTKDIFHGYILVPEMHLDRRSGMDGLLPAFLFNGEYS